MRSTEYWLNRAKRQGILVALAIATTGIAFIATPPPDFRHRFSMATAYAGVIFLGMSLWLGPWNVLRRRANPVSSDLRRDISIWAGILALVHTAVGLTVHLRGRMWMYFFKRLHPLVLQKTLFGFANFIGLGAALLFIVLLVISNDFSLRTLGIRRWKAIQRGAYVAFGLTVMHGIAFQLVEKRKFPWVVLFASLILLVIAIQAVAWVSFARKKQRLIAESNQA